MPPANTAAAEELWRRLEQVLTTVDLIAAGEEAALSKDTVKKKVGWYDEIQRATSSSTDSMRLLHTKVTQWVNTVLSPKLSNRILPAFQQGAGEPEGSSADDQVFELVAKVYRQFSVSKSFAVLALGGVDQGLSRRDGLPTFESLYLKSFHDVVYAKVKDPLTSAIVRRLNVRRSGYQVDMSALGSAVDFLVVVGVSSGKTPQEQADIYRMNFSKPYLTALVKFYQPLAQTRRGDELGQHGYLKWVDDVVSLEMKLVTGFVPKYLNTHEDVKRELEAVLIQPFLGEIVEHPECGAMALLDSWKESEIERMFKLLTLTTNPEGLRRLAEEFKKKVILEGNAVRSEYENQSPSNDKEFIDHCLALFKKYSDMIAKHCSNSATLLLSIRAAFQVFFNVAMKRRVQKGLAPSPNPVFDVESSNSAQVLAIYLDSFLRGETKDCNGVAEEAERLEALADLFSHLSEKDYFQSDHQAKLAKRLLQGDENSSNGEREIQFLSLLRSKMGPGFTHKMETMINDIRGSRPQIQEFLESEIGKSLPSTFDVKVLCAGSWPSYRSDQLVPHESLQRCMDLFRLFYKKKHATRELSWINSLGSSQLLINFPKGPKEVTCSTYQASVLLQLDAFGTLSGEQLAANLKLDFDRLVKPTLFSLQSKQVGALICRGYDDTTGTDPKPLTVDPASFNASVIVQLNKCFMFKLRKFALKGLSSTASTSKETIDKTRDLSIQAAIVRVMKSRKVLSYVELTDLVINQVKKIFSPNPRQIKSNIEDLIQKGYLERDPDVENRFRYLA